MSNNRRGFLRKAMRSAATLTAASFVIVEEGPMHMNNMLVAYADVSDGNTLPQGALQFSRTLKAKSDWATLGLLSLN